MHIRSAAAKRAVLVRLPHQTARNRHRSRGWGSSHQPRCQINCRVVDKPEMSDQSRRRIEFIALMPGGKQGKAGRVAPGDCSPGAPTARTCRITAYGSSSNAFASHTAHGMHGYRRRQRPALLELQELCPGGSVPAAPTTKPFPPDAQHRLPEPG